MTLYDLKNISLSYEEKAVLKEISFSINEKEFVGILGPNGCGKTTLLKLMTGVLKPTGGEILFLDKALEDYSRRDLARRVAVLPQDTLINFPFTALEIVLMGRAPYLSTFQWESKQDLEIALEAMELTDCRQFSNQDVRKLSGGERERVLLARALAQQPDILLLDEPTTHLDLKHQAETFHLLQKLNKDKELTLVVVLHDLNFAAQACGRLLILGGQKLIGDGTPAEVLTSEKVEGVFGVPVLARMTPESNVPWIYPKLM